MWRNQPELPSNLKETDQRNIKQLRTCVFERLKIDSDLLEEILNCNNLIFLHVKIKQIKMQMSTEIDALPTSQIIRAKFIPFLIQLIENNFTSELTYDATWILMNVASGTKQQTQELVDFGCLDLFLSLLDSNYDNIIDQGIWGLANFSGEDTQFRNELLQKNLLQKIIIAERKIQNKESLIWLISNITKDLPLPYPFDKAQFVLIPILADFLMKTSYQKMLKEHFLDALRSLNNIVEVDDSVDELLKVCGLLEAITELLSLGDHDIQFLALKILERISVGTDKQIQTLIDVGCEKIILNLVREDKNVKLMKQAVRTFANICSGNQFSAHVIASDQSIISQIVKIISNNQRSEIVQECLFVLQNIFENAPSQDIKNLNLLGLFNLLKNHVEIISNQTQASIILACFENLQNRYFNWTQEPLYQSFQVDTEWLKPLLLKYKKSITDRTNDLISQVRTAYVTSLINQSNTQEANQTTQ